MINVAPSFSSYSERSGLLRDMDIESRPSPSTSTTEHALSHEQSPAYKALSDAGLIVDGYRLRNSSEVDLTPSNSTVASNLMRRGLAYTAGAVVGGIVYDLLFIQFVVADGCVCPGTHSDGTYTFFGPGVHRVPRAFVSVGQQVSLTERRIEHGNRTITTVPPGFVALAFDRGQPVLLAPGLHQWRSDTMKLSEFIDMSSDVIRIGPFTLLTVDEGYAAITQDNGKQRVLPGGETHMLTHRNWKFEKLISLKISTDDLGPFRATTADNVVLETTATVNWRVEDATLAARMAADTMVVDKGDGDGPTGGTRRGGGAAAGATTGKGSVLRRDVLKQVVGSLAAAIGGVRYADDFHVAASESVTIVDPVAHGANKLAHRQPEGGASGLSQIFSAQQKSTAVMHANEICMQYGVRVVSVNVISAVPKDQKIEESLGAGAVAAAGSVQAEVAARGEAKARLISAQAEAEATRISAEAAADSERVAAQGRLDAAEMLESSAVAVDLTRLERSGQLIGNRTSFFFGAGPSQLPALMANPRVVAKAAPEEESSTAAPSLSSSFITPGAASAARDA